jgi:hypothetical protein
MSSAYRDIHAGFADLETTKAVNQGDAVDGKVIVEVRGDLLNLDKSHGLIRLVLQVEGATIFGMIADESVKDNNGAIFIAANIRCQSDRVYGFVNQRSDISRRRRHGYTLAAAYGGQEGNFVASVKGGVPRGELLIAGGDQGRAVLLKFGVTGGVLGKKRFDIGLDRQVHGLVGAPEDFFQAAEKQDLDADGLGNGRHETIVTCVSRWD